MNKQSVTAIRFSLSLPGKLLGELDRRVIDRGYASRPYLGPRPGPGEDRRGEVGG